MSRHRCILPVLYGLLSPCIGTKPIRAQSPVPAVESAVPDAVPVASEVVVLVGSVDEDLEAARGDLAHTLLQMPLNHLGMRLVERAVTAGEPPDVDPTRVRAIATLPAYKSLEMNSQFCMLHWVMSARARGAGFSSALVLAQQVKYPALDSGNRNGPAAVDLKPLRLRFW